jgi:hypothetical protein
VTGVQTCALPISPKPQNPSKLIYSTNNSFIKKLVLAHFADVLAEKLGNALAEEKLGVVAERFNCKLLQELRSKL